VQKVYQALIEASEAEFASLIDSFSTTERTAAVHAYTLARDESEQEHLAIALTSRPRPEFILPGWLVLQDEIHDPLFLDCIHEIAKAIQSSPPVEDLGPIQLSLDLLCSDQLDIAILSEVFESPAPIDPWLSSFGNAIVSLRQGAALFDHLRGESLMTGPGQFLKQQPLADMLEWVKAATDENKQRFGINYLSKLPLNEARRRLVEYFVKRYGLPASGHRFWSRLHESVRNAIQDMMAVKMLEDFFQGISDPHHRFEFWKGFKRHLRDIQGPTDRRQAILVFPNFFVVEFRDVGNAAYFYRQEHLPRFKERLNGHPSSLKDRRLASERLRHYKGWQETWRWQIRQFISKGSI